MILKFDITQTGATDNIRIVETSLKGGFERASRKAIKKWRYKLHKENGEPIVVSDQTVILTFKLEG